MDDLDLPQRSPTPRAGREGTDGAVHDDPAADLAATIGNDGVGRVLSSPGVQRSGGSSATLDESVARAIEERRGGGRPLPGGVREEMEGSFGTDFSDVRVHDDGDAHELSDSVEARAFTVGNDIFFNEGTYDTASTDGKRLLAHELTHVVQQDGAEGTPATVSDPHDASEQQADAVADQVVSGGPGAVGTASAGVARQPEEELEEPEEVAAARQAPGDEELEEEQAMAARQAPEEELGEEPGGV